MGGWLMERPTFAGVVGPRQTDYPDAPDPVAECATCGDTGWVQTPARLGQRGFGTVRPCKCRPVPGPTFGEFTTKGKDRSVRDALQATREWVVGEGAGILTLSGGVGLGKTHLLKAAYRELCILENPEDARWFSDGKLLDEIHKGFRTGTYETLMGYLGHLPWLLVDDLGVTALSDTTRGAMERIIDQRWQGAIIGRRTLVTTNLAADRFSDRIESRLLDRERARSVHLTGRDHRRWSA